MTDFAQQFGPEYTQALLQSLMEPAPNSQDEIQGRQALLQAKAAENRQNAQMQYQQQQQAMMQSPQYQQAMAQQQAMEQQFAQGQQQVPPQTTAGMRGVDMIQRSQEPGLWRMTERKMRDEGFDLAQQGLDENRAQAEALEMRKYRDAFNYYKTMMPPEQADAQARLVMQGLSPEEFGGLTEKQIFDMSNTIRDDAKPMIDNWNTTNGNINMVNYLIQSAPTGAAQVATLYAFVKGLDPTSVVREGEVALAQQAQSILDQIKTKMENVTEGTIMSPTMQRDILNLTQQLNEIQAESFRKVFVQHAERADQNRIPREYVFGPTMVAAMGEETPRGNRRAAPAPEPGAPPPEPEKATPTPQSLKDRLKALQDAANGG